jgi:sugar transferase (PEP-CTERM/EpsH1 system associated)
MEDLLYLVHRFPYPPNKGDKIRSYHLLKHLSQSYRIHLGAFVDDEKDLEYLGTVKALCEETCFVNLRPTIARLRSAYGLISGQPLTVPYYADNRLQKWVNSVLERHPIRNILIFSSAMAQYVTHANRARRVIDFVDIDSDKWKQYAATARWPMNWIYARESTLLLDYESQIAQDFQCATFVSEAEADLFRQLAPEAASKVFHFNNGVDSDYFSPANNYSSPYPSGINPLVFTGAMDYWANANAVEWFARGVLPLIQASVPEVEFYIVGARPTSAVRLLDSLPGVTVTGSVPDVRPYLAYAALAVAPLRIARGVQNKVLEAMAMEKVVVASSQAAKGISAIPGEELLVADDESEFANRVIALLRAESQLKRAIGEAARARVLATYNWEKNLERITVLLSQPQATRSTAELPDYVQNSFGSAGDGVA